MKRFTLTEDLRVIDTEEGTVLGRIERHESVDGRARPHRSPKRIYWFSITPEGRIVSLCQERDTAALRVIRAARELEEVTLLDLDAPA